MTPPDSGQSGSVVCDCAEVPPTMPTCRGEHLYDCPVAAWQRLAEFKTARLDGTLTRDFAPIKEAMQRGDHATVAKWLNRDGEARARAAYLRSRVKR